MALSQWGTIQGLLQSLLDTDTVLNSMVSEQEFVSGAAKQKEKTRDQGFSDCSRLSGQFGKMFGHPQTNQQMNQVLQSNLAEVSTVYKAFYKLLGAFEQLPVLDEATKYLKKLYKERFDFMYGDTHGVGYLLGPRYIGDGMIQQV